ncbi:hypothetical protein GWK16_22385 [Roseomonas sp. JC162]|uniref:Uncharacterized protein n=1 Tax=Neoroseomonas marina TaxID=1232220 RepID=A0A848EKV2_9PROT|nr:hypothetical protein [Neoroseomonas marina]NMJ44013.1 hypothetical protein [Neoroseomonas marina]
MQAVAAICLVMLVAGLLIEEASPASPVLRVLVLPLGLLPVLGPVWAVATPVLLILMLLTRNQRGPASDA